MLSPKTIKLMMALLLVISSLTVLGVSLNIGRTATANPLKAKLLRRHDKAKDKPNAAEEAFLRQQVGQQDVPKEERKLKTREFKGLPLKVHKIKNLQSDTWHKDLEIEIRNTGTKPIYAIVAYLEFPDHKTPGGRDTGIVLRFGERKYIDIRQVGDPKDLHLDPGDTYVFTISEQFRKGLKIQHERVPEEFKKLDLHFGLISFGDGTGFEAGDFTDYRRIRIPAQNKNHHAIRLSEFRVRSPPQDGCGSCRRYVIGPEPRHVCFNVYTNEFCDSDLVTEVSWARCRLTRSIYWDCDHDPDGTEECYYDVVYDSNICPGYSPTPTPDASPSPTPEPTCNPATKPNPTNCSCNTVLVPIGGDPFWSCYCSAGEAANYGQFPGTPGWAGCDPNKSYNNGGDCCICYQQQCPDGSTPNKYTCECPTPTPTPGGGGGGVGGGPTYYRDYYQDYYYAFYYGYDYCTPYIWVYYVSYDGGETWVETGETEYAGCW